MNGSERRLAVDAPDEALDDWGGDLRRGEPHDRPTREKRFEVFLGVGDKACDAVVTTDTGEMDAALDLDQRAAFEMGEVRAPFPRRMKLEFQRQFRSAEAAPVEGEFRFEARTARRGAKTEVHAPARLSKTRYFARLNPLRLRPWKA